MLESLRIRNIALIDQLEVAFADGLNVLTGETGAGKSVVIGAVGIALGGRFDRTLLRKEEEDGLVEVLFSLPDSVRTRLIREKVLPEDLLTEGEILITRKLSKNRVVNRINGETVPLAQLKETAERLINLHAQHEQTTLLKPARHMEILDASDPAVLAKKAEVREKYGTLQELRRKLERLDQDPGERAKRADFLQFQVREIREAKLRPGEDAELEEAYRRMSHAEELLSICQEVSALTGEETASGCGNQISRAAKRIQDMTRYEADSQLPAQLSEVEALLSDFNQSLTAYMEEMSYDPEELRRISDRLDLLNSLKAKYGRTLEDVSETADALEKELEELTRADE
ncbi:MAG: AAA family ATPase [Eubacterium sp.]|nr:AAA family ATPase [Eubacterium sp.]